MDIEQLAGMTAPDPELFAKFLFTKYAHWRYEKETRAIVPLEKKENGMYFTEFSDDLRLTNIIVGAKSRLTPSMLRGALGDISPSVEIFKARLAFRSFSVVRQRNSKRWTYGDSSLSPAPEQSD